MRAIPADGDASNCLFLAGAAAAPFGLLDEVPVHFFREKGFFKTFPW